MERDETPPPALRRRGKRVFRTLQQIRLSEDGPPLSIAELAAASGFSVSKLHVDVDLGHLVVSYSGYGVRSAFVIDLGEAQRYLRGLGLL